MAVGKVKQVVQEVDTMVLVATVQVVAITEVVVVVAAVIVEDMEAEVVVVVVALGEVVSIFLDFKSFDLCVYLINYYN